MLFLSIFGCDKITDDISPDSKTLTVETIAGDGTFGHQNGINSDARLNEPLGLTTDSNGIVYVADAGNQRIRAIDKDGFVSDYAGTGESGHLDGPKGSAQFYFPQDLSFDNQGNLIVAEKFCIRKIDPNGMVTTIAGQPDNPGFQNGDAEEAQFNTIRSIVVDEFDNIYVSEYYNHVIRQISTDGQVSTFAGSGNIGNLNGLPNESSFHHPQGMAINSSGIIFLADESNNLVRKINNGGVVEIAAGSVYGYENGSNTNARFKSPIAVALDTNNNLYIADSKNYRIRILNEEGIVETLAGNGVLGYKDGIAANALFGDISGIAVDQEGIIYVSDRSNHTIRKIFQK